jgi:hypothetical protein
MQSPFNHDDVLARVAALPQSTRLLFLPCRDRIYRCKVRLRFLEAGSIHPSAAAILRVLENASGSMSIEEIAQAIGASGENGTRFTSELVSRLCYAKEIRLKREGPTQFEISPTGTWRVGPKSFTVIRTLNFVPYSNQIGLRIPNNNAKWFRGVNWWVPPDKEQVYSNESLRTSVGTACRNYAGLERDFVQRYEAMEVLQRARLLRRKSELLDVTVLSVSGSRYKVVHRAYFTATRTSELHCIGVFRLQDSTRQEGYTAYFREAVLRQPDVVGKILQDSDEVRRR